MNERINCSGKRCVIITSYLENLLPEIYTPKPNDYIIAADRGYLHAANAGIIPNLVVGDFDSLDRNNFTAHGNFASLGKDMSTVHGNFASLGKDISTVRGNLGSATVIQPVPANGFEPSTEDRTSSFSGGETKIIQTSAEKDDTDTMLAVKSGLAEGFRDFFIVGGIGGRLDHTFANFQAMSYCIENGAAVWMSDGSNKATMTDAPEFTLKKEDGYYFSLFSWSEACFGITIQNAKYPLNDAVLSQNSPLGVSNEFLEGAARISKSAGRLLIILSQKEA